LNTIGRDIQRWLRRFGTKTSRVYETYGNIGEFDARFRLWLEGSPSKLQAVLHLPGCGLQNHMPETAVGDSGEARRCPGPGL